VTNSGTSVTKLWHKCNKAVAPSNTYECDMAYVYAKFMILNTV